MCERAERMICGKAIMERRHAMCEANAYMLKDGKEELFMEGVAVMTPMENGKLYLMGLSGEQRYIEAKLLWLRLLEHKIILEKT